MTPLTPDEVHLWLADPDDPIVEPLLASYEKILSDGEARRSARLTHAARRREFLLGRALVRTTLSKYHPVPPEGWTFSANAHGRPELEPPWETRFSLTHCEGLVACAVAGARAVGVDAEPLARAGAVHGLAQRVLSDGELDGLRRLGAPAEQQARALSLWTLKEAYLKGLGLGLSVSLRSIGFQAREGRIVVADEERPGNAEAWEFRLLRLEGHVLALAAAHGSGEPLVLRVWGTIPLRGERRRPELEARSDPLPGSDRGR